MLHEQGCFALTGRFVKVNIEVGRAKIAIILGNLIFPDQVVAEGVPCEIADDPMILVQIVAAVAEDEVGRGLRFERFKSLLDGWTIIGKESIAKAMNDDLFLLDSG